jgi:hypothetical protein
MAKVFAGAQHNNSFDASGISLILIDNLNQSVDTSRRVNSGVRRLRPIETPIILENTKMSNILNLAILCFGLLQLSIGWQLNANAHSYTVRSHDKFPRQLSTSIYRIGAFTNIKHTEGHAYGYKVELWRQGDRLFGFFLSAQGLAGDTPTGLLEDVRFNPSTGQVTFRARLTTGLFINRQYDNVPSRDVFHFSGILKRDKLEGILETSNALTPMEAPRRKRITLRMSQEASAMMIEARSYDEWKERADDILKFRGPRW